MKSKLSGWKDVFCFTLTQTLKSKAFIGSFVIMVILALVASPVMNMIMSGEKENENYTIEKLYVYDETGFFIPEDAGAKLSAEGWSTSVVKSDAARDSEAYEQLSASIDEQESNAVMLFITASEGPVSMFLEYSGNGEMSATEVNAFEAVLYEAFEEARYQALGVTKEQQEILAAEVVVNIAHADLQGNVELEEDTSISDFEYWFLYALLFIGMMICMMVGSQVANAIIVEKSSKVVEYLLTSVKPLAIIVGKVLAMLCAVMTEIVGLIAVFAVSNKISGQSSGENVLAKLISPEVLSKLNPVNIVLGLLFVALGMIFYATLAGLAGATVSRMEEAGEGLLLFTLSSLVGVYIGIGAASSLLGTGDNAFAIFAMLFPLSSPFLMPGAILIGKAGVGMILGSFALLLVLIALLFLFVARVYEALIVYNGNRIGLKQLFMMSRR